MSDSTIERTGSCLCGAIQLRIRGPPVRTNLCHCSGCQKATGSFCASVAVYKTEQVTYTLSSPEVLQTYSDGAALSGNIIERSWCGGCGSRVKNVPMRSGGAMTVVPTGIIDGDKGGELKPQSEYFSANRAVWAHEVEGATSFAAMPPPPPAAN